jgi:hypothetical protein
MLAKQRISLEKYYDILQYYYFILELYFQTPPKPAEVRANASREVSQKNS